MKVESVQTDDRQDAVRYNRRTDLAGVTVYLGLEPSEKNTRSIYRQALSGHIPHAKRGKFLIFDLDQIDRWLEGTQRVSVEQAVRNAGGRAS